LFLVRLIESIVLALKENQGSLYENVEDTFRLAQQEQFRHVASHFEQSVEKAHGRLEIRKHWIIDDLEQLSYLDEEGKWKGLQAIGMVQSERRIGQCERCRKNEPLAILKWKPLALSSRRVRASADYNQWLMVSDQRMAHSSTSVYRQMAHFCTNPCTIPT
jgi:hypothetical protein